MKKLLILAGAIAYKGDGYKARIDMELPLLCKYYDVYILLPERDCEISFSENVTITKYQTYQNEAFSRMKSFISFRRKLKELVMKLNGPLIYCEALGAAIKVICLGGKQKCKLVFDCHGTEPDEYRLYHPGVKGRVFAWLMEKLEKRVVVCSDAIITVTNRQYEKWNVSKKHVVLPMLPGPQFYDEENYWQAIREEKKIPKDGVVFLYSGQAQKWQMSEETIQFYKRIEEINEKAFLMILTHDIDKFKEILYKYKVENYIILSVAYEQVPQYLDACDFGFCLRDSSIINRVASPTKVLEYMSRNVMPIITKYVGDFSLDLQENRLAYVLKNELTTDEIRFDVMENYQGREYVIMRREECVTNYLETLSQISG